MTHPTAMSNATICKQTVPWTIAKMRRPERARTAASRLFQQAKMSVPAIGMRAMQAVSICTILIGLIFLSEGAQAGMQLITGGGSVGEPSPSSQSSPTQTPAPANSLQILLMLREVRQETQLMDFLSGNEGFVKGLADLQNHFGEGDIYGPKIDPYKNTSFENWDTNYLKAPLDTWFDKWLDNKIDSLRQTPSGPPSKVNIFQQGLGNQPRVPTPVPQPTPQQNTPPPPPSGSPTATAPLAILTGGQGGDCQTCVAGRVYSLPDTPGSWKYSPTPNCGQGSDSCWQQVSPSAGLAVSASKAAAPTDGAKSTGGKPSSFSGNDNNSSSAKSSSAAVISTPKVASRGVSNAASNAAGRAASSAASRAASNAASNAASRAASNAASNAASRAASNAAANAASRAAPNVRIPSDIRLKRDIVELGRLPNGLHLYRYRYIGDGERYVGVMAQEVAQRVPSAVVRDADDYLQVDYSQLGIEFLTFDEWTARNADRAGPGFSPNRVHADLR